MRTYVLLIALLMAIAFNPLKAQVETPAPSPMVKMEQSVGLTTLGLEYSRPSVKEREIFGSLVPYGKIWRTGANQSTKITFGDDVVFNGKKVKAGTYALYTIPGEDSWTLMLNSDLSIGGNVAAYKEATEVHRSTTTTQDFPSMIESMLIYIDDLRDGSATFNLVWAKTHIQVPIDLDTDENVMASIKATMAGPSANDYYRAALYYYNNDKSIAKAEEWITKASDMRPEAYWVATWKARILKKAGKTEKAKKTAKMALGMAEKAGNQDFVKINKDMLSEMK